MRTQNRDIVCFAELEVEQEAANPGVVDRDPKLVATTLGAKQRVSEHAVMARLEAGSEAEADARRRREGQRVLVDPQLLGMADEPVGVPKLTCRDPAGFQDIAGRDTLLLEQGDEFRRVHNGNDCAVHWPTVPVLA